MKWTDNQCSVCGRTAKEGEMFIFLLKPIKEWQKFMDGKQFCQQCYNAREEKNRSRNRPAVKS